MTVNRPCYVTREQVMRAGDIKYSAYSIEQVDRAIESASDNLDGNLLRRFYCAIETNKWDWPNFDYAYPWRLWLKKYELADITGVAPVVTTGGNVIPDTACKFGPWNEAPPYRFLELDRSMNYSFGGGTTPQQDISIQGLYGYWDKRKTAGALGAAITSAGATTIQVTNSAVPGVGDVLIIGSERMLVQDRSWINTGQTQQGTGCSTQSPGDNALTVTDGTKYGVNETLLLDQERMFVYQITGNVLTVKRAVDGTVLQAHTAANVWAARELTVTRGDFGTTATTYANSTALQAQLVPSLVRDVALAEAAVQANEELGGYSDPQGEGAARIANLGAGLADKWDEVMTAFGRQLRTAVI